jgi:CRP-like cAMP-binding protein
MSHSRIRILDFLSNVPLFRDLDSAQFARLADGSDELDVLRGAVVYHRGEPCTGLHAVVYGQIKLSLQTSRGDEMVVELAGPGTTFGEAALFSGRPHIVAAEALADSKLLHVAKEVLLAELERDPRFSSALVASLGDQLYRRMTEFEGYFLSSGTERVISYLLRGENGHSVRDVEQITLPATKGVIASRLNLTHEHFSRILRELITAGLIEVDGREVRILNKKRLFGYSG